MRNQKVTLPRGEPAEEIDWESIDRYIRNLALIYPHETLPILINVIRENKLPLDRPKKES